MLAIIFHTVIINTSPCTKSLVVLAVTQCLSQRVYNTSKKPEDDEQMLIAPISSRGSGMNCQTGNWLSGFVVGTTVNVKEKPDINISHGYFISRSILKKEV